MTTATQTETAGTRTLTAAWQDGLEALMGGYVTQMRRLTELTTDFYSLRWLNRPETRETMQKITERTREIAAARAEIAGEWLRAPLWLTGAASPRDLQTRYLHLFEAHQGLAGAYIEAALDVQRALLGASVQAAETVREAVDAQTDTARRVTKDAATLQQAATNGARRGATTTQQTVAGVAGAASEAAARVVEQAGEAAAVAAEQAELALRPIKGNVNARGEKIYHLPGQANYDRVEAEQTFATEDEAQAAGFRASQR